MTIPELAGAAVTIIGATWALRSKLSDIETVLVGHVERDDERHKDHSSRIVRLEDWKDRNGRR